MIGAGDADHIWHGQRQPDLRPVSRQSRGFAGHQLDGWPVLAEVASCFVEIVSLHSDAAGLPAAAGRYLKVEVKIDSFGVFRDRAIIVAHLVSPHFALRTHYVADLDFRGARLWQASARGFQGWLLFKEGTWSSRRTGRLMPDLSTLNR